MRENNLVREMFVALAVVFFLGGCSHLPGNGVGLGTNNAAPVTLTFHDTPPNNVTVLSFEVTVTGAVLQPGNVSLLKTPQTLELTQLQTESAFLSTTNVSAGTYQSLAITYANPKLTILNDSGATISAFGQTCANGQICVFTPTATSTTATISSAPFPLVIAIGQPTLAEVDVNLNTIIQSGLSLNFSSSGAVTVNQLASSQGSSPLDSLEDVIGQVTALGSNQFTFAAASGQTFTVTANGSTAFEFAADNCSSNSFSCLAVGQIVEADLSLLGNGTFAATEIDFESGASTQEIGGTIVSLGAGSPPSSFQMVVHTVVPASSSISLGSLANATIQNGATFTILNGSFNIIGSGTFAGASDLFFGQEVQALVSGTVSSGPPVAFTTNGVALRPSEFSANVSTLNPTTSSMTLTGLSTLFTNPPANVSQIQALTSSQTEFEELSPDNFSGLTVGSSIFAEGFLFNTTGTTGSVTLAARKVRGPVPGT